MIHVVCSIQWVRCGTLIQSFTVNNNNKIVRVKAMTDLDTNWSSVFKYTDGAYAGLFAYIQIQQCVGFVF